MRFDGNATGRYRVPGFGQDWSIRRSDFGRTGPQADVDVQAGGGCRVLRGRTRRVRFRGMARGRKEKRPKSEELCTPSCILPHVRTLRPEALACGEWGRN